NGVCLILPHPCTIEQPGEQETQKDEAQVRAYPGGEHSQRWQDILSVAKTGAPRPHPKHRGHDEEDRDEERDEHGERPPFPTQHKNTVDEQKRDQEHVSTESNHEYCEQDEGGEQSSDVVV